MTQTEYVGRHRLPETPLQKRLQRFFWGEKPVQTPSPVNTELGKKLMAHHDEEEV